MGSNLVLRRLYALFRNSTMLWAALCCIDLYQGCNERDTIPRAPNRCGAPNDYGWLQNVATMSQVLSSIQYICFRKTLGSNMGAPNFLLVPGAIQHRYAPDLYVFKTNGQPLGLRSLYSTQREMRSNLSNYERITHSPKNAEPGKNATRQSLEAWSAIKGKRRWTMRKQRHATIPRTFTKHVVKILLCVH